MIDAFNSIQRLQVAFKIPVSIIWYVISASILIGILIYVFRDGIADTANCLKAVGASALAPLLPFLAKVISFKPEIEKAQSVVSKVKSNIEAIIAESVDLENNLNQAKEDAETKRTISKLQAEITEFEERKRIFEGNTLKETVADRIDSYEDDLGIVHKAQRDFKELTDAMVAGDKSQFPRGKPRIFLFIEDLDLCSPDIVMSVLQAVELLVKTELFVTIISMDMRYITTCLEQHPAYKNILVHNESLSGTHYLGRIFDLTYRIPVVQNEDELKEYVHLQSFQKEKKKDLQKPMSNLETTFSNEDIATITDACLIIRANRKNTDRIILSFDVLDCLWRRLEYYPEQVERNACIALLALSVSSDAVVRKGVKKAFWILEIGKSREESFKDFWKNESIISEPDSVPQPTLDLMEKYLDLEMKKWSTSFWQARSLAFIGDDVTNSTFNHNMQKKKGENSKPM